MSDMVQFGAVLPQTEIGAGPEDIRAFADGVAGLGLSFVTMYDHVLGADRTAYPGWAGPYDHTHLFHEPFVTLGAEGQFDVVARITGGGVTGQAGALRLGIARALTLVDPENRVTLKRAGFLTRDARIKERKKYGQKGARRRFQFSKR